MVCDSVNILLLKNFINFFCTVYLNDRSETDIKWKWDL